jgi:hypothetical protein
MKHYSVCLLFLLAARRRRASRLFRQWAPRFHEDQPERARGRAWRLSPACNRDAARCHAQLGRVVMTLPVAVPPALSQLHLAGPSPLTIRKERTLTREIRNTRVAALLDKHLPGWRQRRPTRPAAGAAATAKWEGDIDGPIRT